MKRTGLKRSVALAMCFLLLAAAFLSIAYLTENRVHDCTDRGCGTCAQLRVAEGVLRGMGTALVLLCLLLCLAVPGLRCALSLIRGAEGVTLVSLKVRFNN